MLNDSARQRDTTRVMSLFPMFCFVFNPRRACDEGVGNKPTKYIQVNMGYYSESLMMNGLLLVEKRLPAPMIFVAGGIQIAEHNSKIMTTLK